jgi:putative tryptophan/tyrosine transport system substrate-binding protein
MRRRDFLGVLGGAAAWPVTAGAQQPSNPVIGFLNSGGMPNASTLAALRKGLGEMGFVEGRNVAIEARGTDQYDQFPALAADLVRRQVAVIFAWGTANAALAAKAATSSIPIVFANGSDPVKSGIVESLNRPGGNITGVTFYNSGLVAKRLEMLREMVPHAKVIGFLTNPRIQTSDQNLKDMQAAIDILGGKLLVMNASTEDEIDKAFADAAGQKVDALLVGPDPTFTVRRVQIVGLAERYRIPANYFRRVFCDLGGLSSYGTDFADSERQAGIYIGRILAGEKPADLPIQQPTKYETVINLKTAKALGLTVPPSLLATVDEVIE